jgi:deoxyribose-phosphate aldolase
MNIYKIDTIVDQIFIEKSLKDFYQEFVEAKKWERNVIEKPEAVKKIIENGAERIAAGLGVGSELKDIALARMIDHTLLKPEATEEEILKLCEEAKTYHFASVCVNPCWVRTCYEILKDTDVRVCTVIGFPLGATTTEVKRYETEQALDNGASEIDMVINIGKLKSCDYDYVFNDINQVALACKKRLAVCKVILETSLLTDREKVIACVLSKKAQADYVKTSTGFSKGGATAADVALMRYVVGSAVGVKASGGIRSYEDALKMIESGADRIGASASVKIISGKGASDGNY